MTAPIDTILLRTFALLAALSLSFFAACQSYQPGHPAELPFETIYIQPAKNDSFAPQAQALLSAQVREAVIGDGRVRLIADRSEADTVLLMTLSDYTRRAGARRQDDTELAQDFDLTLRVQLDLYDQRNGSYLFEDRQLEAQTRGYINDPYAATGEPDTQGLIQSEFNAMPRLARELGRKAADELLGVW